MRSSVLLPQRDIGTLLEMIPPTELHGHDVLLQTALPARAPMVSVVRRSSPAYSNSAPCILASAWAEASAAPVCLLNAMGKLRFGTLSGSVRPTKVGRPRWPDQGGPTRVACARLTRPPCRGDAACNLRRRQCPCSHSRPYSCAAGPAGDHVRRRDLPDRGEWDRMFPAAMGSPDRMGVS